MKKISFSVITPTYNRLKSGFLEECINSIQKQNGSNFTFEHIIVNDASTDGTAEWLEKAAKSRKNIVVINHEHNGDTAVSYMDGLKKAKNDYIIFIDDDDSLPLNSLEIRAEYALKYPKTDWFYGKAQWVDERGDAIPVTFQSSLPENNLYERALIQNFIHNGTPTMKRDALAGFSWPDWLTKRQDYFLWLELLKPSRHLSVGFIDKVILTYRVHKDAFTTSWQNDKEVAKFMDDLGFRLKKEYHSESLANMSAIANSQRLEIRRLKREITKLQTK
jgi:teichuronic acid biosynthesis glycosyltransferase TuaG